MPFVPEGMWQFRNGDFSLCIRLVTKQQVVERKHLFSKSEIVEKVQGHQLCLACIKKIVAGLKQPESEK